MDKLKYKENGWELTVTIDKDGTKNIHLDASKRRGELPDSIRAAIIEHDPLSALEANMSPKNDPTKKKSKK